MTHRRFLVPPPPIIDISPADQSVNPLDMGNANWNTPDPNTLPDALAANQNKSKSWFSWKLLGLAVLVVAIAGILYYVIIVIRKRRQTPNQNVQITPANSIASSTMSDAPTYANP